MSQDQAYAVWEHRVQTLGKEHADSKKSELLKRDFASALRPDSVRRHAELEGQQAVC